VEFRPILRGLLSDALAKNGHEFGGGAESGSAGDFMDSQGRVPQQRLGAFEPQA